MKNLLILITFFALFTNIKAQDTTWAEFTPNGYTVLIDVDHIFNESIKIAGDTQKVVYLINTIKQYHHKGTAYEGKIDTALAAVYGEQRAFLIDKNRDQDIMLCMAFDILRTQIQPIQQEKFKQLLYAKIATVKLNDFVTGWNDSNGINVGSYSVDIPNSRYCWLLKRDGTGVQVLKASLTIATDEEYNDYY